MTAGFTESEIKQAASSLAMAISCAFKEAVRTMKKIAMSIRNGYLIYSYTENPRVKHLALHARKARTRKKNYHRILKENRRNR